MAGIGTIELLLATINDTHKTTVPMTLIDAL